MTSINILVVETSDPNEQSKKKKKTTSESFLLLLLHKLSAAFLSRG